MRSSRRSGQWAVGLAGALGALPAFAQQAPFEVGANSLVAFYQAIATPVAVLGVAAFAIAAGTRAIRWGAAIGGMVAVVLLFGAPQIVAWVRGMFGV